MPFKNTAAAGAGAGAVGGAGAGEAGGDGAGAGAAGGGGGGAGGGAGAGAAFDMVSTTRFEIDNSPVAAFRTPGRSLEAVRTASPMSTSPKAVMIPSAVAPGGVAISVNTWTLPLKSLTVTADASTPACSLSVVWIAPL